MNLVWTSCAHEDDHHPERPDYDPTTPFACGDLGLESCGVGAHVRIYPVLDPSDIDPDVSVFEGGGDSSQTGVHGSSDRLLFGCKLILSILIGCESSSLARDWSDHGGYGCV